MSLVGYRMHEVSRQISNFDIAFVLAPRMSNMMLRETCTTHSHIFITPLDILVVEIDLVVLASCCASRDFMNKKITSVLSPHDDPLIDGRVAML